MTPADRFRDRYIWARYIAGLLMRDIAEEAGISGERVRQIVDSESERHRRVTGRYVPVLDEWRKRSYDPR